MKLFTSAITVGLLVASGTAHAIDVGGMVSTNVGNIVQNNVHQATTQAVANSQAASLPAEKRTPGNPSEYGNPDGIVSSSDTATSTTTSTEITKSGLPSGTYAFHVTGNYGTLTLNVNNGTISGQDNFPDWRHTDGQHGIKCTISGTATTTSPGKGTIEFTRVAWSGLTQVYKGEWEISGNKLKVTGKWLWQGQEQGPWEAYMSLEGGKAPDPVPQKSINLALAIDAEFQNEADCRETIQTALRVTNRLIPAGAGKVVTEANAYCKSLFPTANSPAVKVTMASQFVVNSLEECSMRLNTAKGYSVSARHVVGDHLEEVGDVRELCEAKFLAAGDGELQDLLEKSAAAADLKDGASAQVIKIDASAPAREPASEK